MAFHVGQRVVCVNNTPMPGMIFYPGTELILGETYTISGFGKSPYGDHEVVYLVERSNPVGYSTWRFRPLTDRKSSISFTMGADPESEKWDNRKRVKVRS